MSKRKANSILGMLACLACSGMLSAEETNCQSSAPVQPGGAISFAQSLAPPSIHVGADGQGLEYSFYAQCNAAAPNPDNSLNLSAEEPNRTIGPSFVFDIGGVNPGGTVAPITETIELRDGDYASFKLDFGYFYPSDSGPVIVRVENFRKSGPCRLSTSVRGFRTSTGETLYEVALQTINFHTSCSY